MSDLYRIVGETVRHKRKEAGMTQGDLALAVGLSRPSIANIETGRQSILLHQAFDLARALSCSVDDLVPGFSPKARDIIRIHFKRFPEMEAA